MFDFILLAAEALPVPTTHPASGDFWNPANWSAFVKEVGIPGFFAVVFFIALAYLWIKQLKQPTNRHQVLLLKLMYADSQRRNVLMRRVLGMFCDVVGDIVPPDSTKVRDRLQRIHNVLNAQPPQAPADLAMDDDDSNDDKG